jgi:hypothetical protein
MCKGGSCTGQTIFEWAGTSRGAHEARDLTDELLGMLDGKDLQDLHQSAKAGNA